MRTVLVAALSLFIAFLPGRDARADDVFDRQMAELATAARTGPSGNCVLLFSSVQNEEVFRATLAKADLPSFARNTTEYGQETSLDVSEGTLAQMEGRYANGKLSDSDLYSFVEGKIEKTRKTPWEFSLIPREPFRRTALFQDVAFANFRGDQGFFEKPTWLGAPLKEFPPGKWDQHFEEVLARVKRDSATETAEALGRPGNLELGILCAQYGLLDTLKCTEALRKVIDRMNPYSVTLGSGRSETLAFVTMPETIVEFVRDARNYEPIRKAADRMWDWVESADKAFVPDTDFFSLVRDAYSAEGFGAEEAAERAWQFMGIYATRGTNIGATIDHFTHGTDFSRIAGAFSVLAHGTGILDARALRNGRPLFSYPPGVVSHIDNSKPYHFWLSAYLARECGRAVGHAEAGKDAAWLGAIGYQMKSKTNGRDPNRIFTVDPYDPANNKIRMDLAYAAAGAVFGKNSWQRSTPLSLNVDEGFRTLLLSGEPLKPVTPDLAQDYWSGTGKDGYFRWRRIMNPDAALDFFESRSTH